MFNPKTRSTWILSFKLDLIDQKLFLKLDLSDRKLLKLDLIDQRVQNWILLTRKVLIELSLLVRLQNLRGFTGSILTRRNHSHSIQFQMTALRSQVFFETRLLFGAVSLLATPRCRATLRSLFSSGNSSVPGCSLEP